MHGRHETTSTIGGEPWTMVEASFVSMKVGEPCVNCRKGICYTGIVLSMPLLQIRISAIVCTGISMPCLLVLSFCPVAHPTSLLIASLGVGIYDSWENKNNFGF
ncbi:hypothetical protein V6N13_068411 [Hibiscus sabdariffa]|uniref:Uncharacterized protein n=1 Tax=Hibiscus sabdariffa TaxID=183260 RepID=A0ABR2QMJ9_9ROSI